MAAIGSGLPVREPNCMAPVASFFIGMEDYGMITKAISYAAWFFTEIVLCVPVITIPLYTRLVEEYTAQRFYANAVPGGDGDGGGAADSELAQVGQTCRTANHVTKIRDLQGKIRKQATKLNQTDQELNKLKIEFEKQGLRLDRAKLEIATLQRGPQQEIEEIGREHVEGLLERQNAPTLPNVKTTERVNLDRIRQPLIEEDERNLRRTSSFSRLDQLPKNGEIISREDLQADFPQIPQRRAREV
jgi:hypothetical protein